MSRLDYPNRTGNDRTGLYVSIAAGALAVIGLLAWAGSNDVQTDPNPPAQTQQQTPNP